MHKPAHITAKHVENGVAMKRIVEDDILNGKSFKQAVSDLADYLGIAEDSVKLGIGIAKEWGNA